MTMNPSVFPRESQLGARNSGPGLAESQRGHPVAAAAAPEPLHARASHPRRTRVPVWVLAVGLCMLLTGAGCRSTGAGGSGGLASVTVQDHSLEEIATVTTAVFVADGYQGGGLLGGKMTFEKGASRLTTLSRDGLYATQQGAQTINRVRVEIIPLGPGTHRLQCQAYLVSGGSDPFFQEEARLTRLRSGPYQALLNKVKKQLK